MGQRRRGGDVSATVGVGTIAHLLCAFALSSATGGGLNGANFLKGPGTGQIVFNDTQIDTLLDETETDWFFADPTGTSGETTDCSGVEQLVDL